MTKVDEYYKEWCGKHHIENSCIPTHDSAECCDFAEQFARQQAIDFKKWCDANTYLLDNVEQHSHTINELYNLFLQDRKV